MSQWMWTIVIVLVVLLLFGARMGIAGIFLSNLISSAMVVALLAPMILRRLEFRMPRGLLRALLASAFPPCPRAWRR